MYSKTVPPQQELKKCLRRDLAISPKALSDFDMKAPRKIGANTRPKRDGPDDFPTHSAAGKQTKRFQFFCKRVLVFLPEGFYKYH